MRNLLSRKNKKAASLMEYIALLLILLAAYFVTQKFVVRSFAGRWKQVGDSFGYGLQYDPRATAECSWYQDPNNSTLGNWYSQKCFEGRFDSDYRTAYNNCYAHCETMGTCNDGNVPSCCVWLPWPAERWVCDPTCCYFNCKEKCTKRATRTSVNLCSSVTVNGITRTCNDW